jgi:hypothetical protein
MSVNVQAELSRAAILRLATADIAAAPTDGVASIHRTMSPRTPTGQRTTGLAVGIKAPTVGAAVAVAGGFSLVAWVFNPVTSAWFACSAASIAFNEFWVSFDFNASSLYLQVEAASVATPGLLDFHLWEQ